MSETMGVEDTNPPIKEALLKASIETLQALVQDLEASLEVYEAAFEPVLWICHMSHCGAPNETPRLLVPAPNNTLAVSLKCTTCQCLQNHQMLKAYL